MDRGPRARSRIKKIDQSAIRDGYCERAKHRTAGPTASGLLGVRPSSRRSVHPCSHCDRPARPGVSLPGRGTVGATDGMAMARNGGIAKCTRSSDASPSSRRGRGTGPVPSAGVVSPATECSLHPRPHGRFLTSHNLSISVLHPSCHRRNRALGVELPLPPTPSWYFFSPPSRLFLAITYSHAR